MSNKKLILIRHAKADWPKNIPSDFERPLLPEGKTDALELGLFFSKNRIMPNLVICSPAKRTTDTFSLINQHLQLNTRHLKYEPVIYEAAYTKLLEVVNNIDSYETVALIGHNNGISELANYLSGEFINLPPAGTLLIEFPFDSWKMLSGGTGEIRLARYPEK